MIAEIIILQTPLPNVPPPSFLVSLKGASLAMGLFSSFIDLFCERCSTESISTLALVGALSFISLSVVVNVLRQLLFKSPHEPPVVFHWFPFVGSTISYGIDPYKFFFNARAKVCISLPSSPGKSLGTVSHGGIHSTATFSLSSSSARRPRSIWVPRAMTSF